VGASAAVGFAQGDVVQKEGQQVTAILFPLSGMLSLLVVLKGGRKAETSVVGREGVVGARTNTSLPPSVIESILVSVPISVRAEKR
jgi:hypothetical protein